MDKAIQDILEQPENHRLDFKRIEKIEDEEGLAKHLVSFANRYGGKLVFGITDDREIEGVEICEEDVLETVRRIARIRCNPPVRFEERFYPEQEGTERSGDVVVIDIHPRRSGPHAVVEGENNAKRMYYIRSADESRLITDAEELNHLFLDSSDPSFVESLSTSVVHGMWTYDPIQLRPSLGGWSDYREFFRNLVPEQRQALKERETTETDQGERVGELRPMGDEDAGSRLIREVFPAVLFHSFRHRSHDFWIRDRSSNNEEYQAYHRYTKELSRSDIDIIGEGPVVSELSVDLDDIYYSQGDLLSVPYGTQVTIEYSDKEEKPPRLAFRCDEQLTLEIALYFGNHPTIMGAPLAYPGTIPEDASPFTRRYTSVVEADFGFPDVEDPQIRIHQAFAEGITQFVKNRWDMDEFQNDQPNRELFRIGEKVDEIQEQLSHFDGEE